MKVRTKRKLRKITIKLLKITLILATICMIYSSGRMRGIIDGIYITQEKHNDTMCNFLNKTRDNDGFCLITDNKYEYRWYKDCGWEKFKIDGERKPPFPLIIAEEIRGILFYPLLGC